MLLTVLSGLHLLPGGAQETCGSLCLAWPLCHCPPGRRQPLIARCMLLPGIVKGAACQLGCVYTE